MHRTTVDVIATNQHHFQLSYFLIRSPLNPSQLLQFESSFFDFKMYLKAQGYAVVLMYIDFEISMQVGDVSV